MGSGFFYVIALGHDEQHLWRPYGASQQRAISRESRPQAGILCAQKGQCPISEERKIGRGRTNADVELPDFIEKFAEALKSLFHDKAKRESLILRGKERARRFTGKDFAKGLLGLLDEFEPIRRCWPSDPGP